MEMIVVKDQYKDRVGVPRVAWCENEKWRPLFPILLSMAHIVANRQKTKALQLSHMCF